MPRRIVLARSAGQCFGVKRACNIALEAAKGDGSVVMLGDIVHNEHVIRRIADAGVRVVDSLADVAPGTTLLVRAHGAAPAVFEEARRRGLRIVDATCPLVHEIHRMAREMAGAGYRLVVIGDHGHDEVVGIAGQADGAVVISRPEEVAERLPARMRRVGVVVQSTQDIDNVRRILAELVPRVHELRYVDTICGPTKVHQREIRELPAQVDVVVVVGSFKSANTCRLTEISRAVNPRTHQVEDAAGLDAAWFAGAATVGVTAGASTPDEVIAAVVAALEALPD